MHSDLLPQQLARQDPVNEMPSQIVIIEILGTESRYVRFANINAKISISATSR